MKQLFQRAVGPICLLLGTASLFLMIGGHTGIGMALGTTAFVLSYFAGEQRDSIRMAKAGRRMGCAALGCVVIVPLLVFAIYASAIYL